MSAAAPLGSGSRPDEHVRDAALAYQPGADIIETVLRMNDRETLER